MERGRGLPPLPPTSPVQRGRVEQSGTSGSRRGSRHASSGSPKHTRVPKLRSSSVEPRFPTGLNSKKCEGTDSKGVKMIGGLMAYTTDSDTGKGVSGMYRVITGETLGSDESLDNRIHTGFQNDDCTHEEYANIGFLNFPNVVNDSGTSKRNANSWIRERYAALVHISLYGAVTGIAHSFIAVAPLLSAIFPDPRPFGANCIHEPAPIWSIDRKGCSLVYLTNVYYYSDLAALAVPLLYSTLCNSRTSGYAQYVISYTSIICGVLLLCFSQGRILAVATAIITIRTVGLGMAWVVLLVLMREAMKRSEGKPLVLFLCSQYVFNRVFRLLQVYIFVTLTLNKNQSYNAVGNSTHDLTVRDPLLERHTAVLGQDGTWVVPHRVASEPKPNDERLELPSLLNLTASLELGRKRSIFSWLRRAPPSPFIFQSPNSPRTLIRSANRILPFALHSWPPALGVPQLLNSATVEPKLAASFLSWSLLLFAIFCALIQLSSRRYFLPPRETPGTRGGRPGESRSSNYESFGAYGKNDLMYGVREEQNSRNEFFASSVFERISLEGSSPSRTIKHATEDSPLLDELWRGSVISNALFVRHIGKKFGEWLTALLVFLSLFYVTVVVTVGSSGTELLLGFLSLTSKVCICLLVSMLVFRVYREVAKMRMAILFAGTLLSCIVCSGLFHQPTAQTIHKALWLTAPESYLESQIDKELQLQMQIKQLMAYHIPSKSQTLRGAGVYDWKHQVQGGSMDFQILMKVGLSCISFVFPSLTEDVVTAMLLPIFVPIKSHFLTNASTLLVLQIVTRQVGRTILVWTLRWRDFAGLILLSILLTTTSLVQFLYMNKVASDSLPLVRVDKQRPLSYGTVSNRCSPAKRPSTTHSSSGSPQDTGRLSKDAHFLSNFKKEASSAELLNQYYDCGFSILQTYKNYQPDKDLA